MKKYVPLLRKYVPALAVAAGLILAAVTDLPDLAIAVGIVAAFAGIIWLAGRWVPDRPPVRANAVRERLRGASAWDCCYFITGPDGELTFVECRTHLAENAERAAAARGDFELWEVGQ